VRYRAIEEGRLNPSRENRQTQVPGSWGWPMVCFGLERLLWSMGWWKAWAAIVGKRSSFAPQLSWAALAEPQVPASLSPLLIGRNPPGKPFSKNSTGKPRPVTQLPAALLQRNSPEARNGLGPCS